MPWRADIFTFATGVDQMVIWFRMWHPFVEPDSSKPCSTRPAGTTCRVAPRPSEQERTAVGSGTAPTALRDFRH